MDFASRGGAGASGEQGHFDADAVAPGLKVLEMLEGEYLCRCHKARLIVVVYGHKHGHERHEGLAAAYVALQQPVHLAAGLHVGSDFLEHAFLCPGERKRKHVGIEMPEGIADTGKHQPLYFLSPFA